MEAVYETYSTQETRKLEEKIDLQATPEEDNTLTRDLGVGKTVINKGVEKGLGIDEQDKRQT